MTELAGQPLSRNRSIMTLPILIEMLLADMNMTADKEPDHLRRYTGLNDAFEKSKQAKKCIVDMIPLNQRRHVIQGSSLRAMEACQKHLMGSGEGRSAETYVYTILRLCELLHEKSLWALPDCDAARRYDALFRDVMTTMLSWVNSKPDLVEAWEKKSVKMAEKILAYWQQHKLFTKPIYF